MAKRKKMRPKKDAAVFTQTSKKTKRINLDPHIHRGGIRL